MKNTSVLLLLLSVILSVGNLNAEDDTWTTPKLGEPTNGGVYLYYEPIEMYSNNWIAYPLINRKNLPSDDQVESLIKGEGKTASFYGVLSINCNNGKYFWEGIPSDGGNALNESSIKSVVPAQVIKNATSLFCKKGQKKIEKHHDIKKLSVPVMIGGDAYEDACGSLGVIRGINKHGDGFVVLRGGPGTKYKIIDKFYTNGTQVMMCDDNGKWIGVVYGDNCGISSPVKKRQPYSGKCRRGWIYGKYVQLIAG